jgi:hypothetical protein
VVRQELRQSIERFRAVQADHREALRQGKLADCMRWRGEREAAFRELQQGLLQLGDTAADVTEEELAALCQEIVLLLDDERQLAAVAKERQRQIEKQQSAIRRGRKMLAEFGAMRGGVRGTLPRIVSNKA